jgi:hypothetical protein
MSETRATGGCLCGGVRYEVRGPLRQVWACHCSQCRRTSGNFVAATRVRSSDLALVTAETLTWYRSSDNAERGFCGRCGSPLFWRRTTARDGHTSINAGSLDTPTRLKTVGHIFVADKPDFYEITDGLPQHAGWPA